MKAPALRVQSLLVPGGETAAEIAPSRGERPVPERLAAIDIGSNSIHMIVVAPEPSGGYRVLGQEREMVRLGRSALGGGALSEAAMRDGLETLLKMTQLAGLKGARRVVAVATSAVREAENGEEFLSRVKAQTGIGVQRLSGEAEGLLIYRAVREVVDLGQGPAAVVDVGGGSTEWIATAGGRVERVVSLRLGSLRCAGDLEGDPPGPREIERLRRRMRKALAGEVTTRPVARLVATSGTAVCCADLADLFADRNWKGAGSALREVRAKELSQVVARLSGLTRREIAGLPPVGGPRSESLLAGAVLLDELVRHAGVDRFQVSDRALREGLVLAALGQPVPIAREPEDLRRRQVLQLAERTESVYRHSLQSARLAVRLFDLTVSVHGLGAREREWLEYAALLHDIGYSIHYQSHHKHTYYLIANATLDAFDQREIEIIAHVARYHRGARPDAAKQPTLAALKPWQQRTIQKLSALLRVADSLDRTHASRVEEVFSAIRKRAVKLEVMSRYEVDLELEAAREQAPFFEQVFGRKLALRQGLEVAAS
ncbi:MAG TPA: Ppx/GppA phosphatase family protein [Thermoanaerobaculia bacterium]|nr:Ppx/GppA phosphatase family protein [Thermoanaerobaculia bacterium]